MRPKVLEQIKPLLKRTLTGVSLLLLIFSLLPFAPTSNFLTDIPSHFIHLWLPLTIGCCIAYTALFKSIKIYLIGVPALLACIVTLMHIPTAIPVEHLATKTLSIYQINTQTANSSTALFLSSVQESAPDIIIVAEVNSAFRRSFGELHKDYPYMIDNGKTAVLARSKLSHITKLGRDEAYFIGADITWEDHSISIATFHPPTPLQSVKERDEGFVQAAQWTERRKNKNLIVAGDFNATPYTPIMRQFMNKYKLRSVSQGVFKTGTYPSWLPAPLRLPIDHILISDKFQLQDFIVKESISSDHLPSVAIISLP